MDFNEYQRLAFGTVLEPDRMKVVYASLGLAGETGEVVDKVKKIIRDHNSDFTTQEHRMALARELGDVLWYLSLMAHDLGLTLDEVAQINIDKIYSRKHRDKIHGSGDER